jgi:hypothetical protein
MGVRLHDRRERLLRSKFREDRFLLCNRGALDFERCRACVSKKKSDSQANSK